VPSDVDAVSLRSKSIDLPAAGGGGDVKSKLNVLGLTLRSKSALGAASTTNLVGFFVVLIVNDVDAFVI